MNTHKYHIRELFGAFLFCFIGSISFAQEEKVEKWDVFEIEIEGPKSGNPFLEVQLTGVFRKGEKEYRLDGFYDGDGVYKIRFMPDEKGKWTYETRSNSEQLNNLRGEFTCIPASHKNHGPVKVRDKFHFTYEDGGVFFPFGTTAYEWSFQNEETKKQTLETLKESPFNKLRFLAVPPYKERYTKGKDSLTDFPFEGNSKENWNFERFNPEFFQSLEKDVQDLQEIGVQADFILFRPYDNEAWGFDTMNKETNERFLKYIIARFAVYRNIWWSMANEYSFMDEFSTQDWDELFQILKRKDPYSHLRSIHNAGEIYDYNKPWITHVSLQYYNAVRVPGVSPLLHDLYQKPVVHDEINYEGNSPKRWGQLSGEELTFRFWNAYMGGAYATHGEVLKGDWLSNGGKLRGESPERIGFLKEIIEDGPAKGLKPIDQYYLNNMAGKPGSYYLIYFGKEKPLSWDFVLPDDGLEEGIQFKVDVIDTWNMTITPIDKVFEVEELDNYNFIDKDQESIQLPGKEYFALRIQKVKKDTARKAPAQH